MYNMALLELVKHGNEMRKLFGQQELRIIEKQLLGVTLSPSEKTRLSRDIRPKFNIIETLSNFSGEFRIKKGQEIKYLINEARELILEFKQNKRIEKIWLFGSSVENQLRLDSDIDIAIEFKKITKKQATKFLLNIQGKLSEKIQLSIYNILPKKIQRVINEKGRIIYQNDSIK